MKRSLTPSIHVSALLSHFCERKNVLALFSNQLCQVTQPLPTDKDLGKPLAVLRGIAETVASFVAGFILFFLVALSLHYTYITENMV